MKIAIVGAGICGLYLGWKLAERGNQVTIFEKKEKIGKEVCSGLFSERILDFIPESQKLIQNEIEYCLIHFPKRTLKIKFSRKFLVMGRFEIDRLVASLAEKSGAEIILKSQINSLGDELRSSSPFARLCLARVGDEDKSSSSRTSSLERVRKNFNSFDFARLRLARVPEGFDKIIGCDGPNSIIRKSLGLPNPTYRLAIQGFFPREDNSDFVETWPIGGFTLRPFTLKGAGFIWKIPKGKEIEYGIIGPQNCQNIFEEFLKINNLKLERLNSAIIPQGLIIPAHPSITLCGDAVGLTKPWSGGGVVWGLTAAEILLSNFPDFLKYQKAIKKIFLPKIIFSKILTSVVYFLGFKIPWLFPRNIKIESDFLI